jgi:hypothetical protein
MVKLRCCGVEGNEVSIRSDNFDIQFYVKLYKNNYKYILKFKDLLYFKFDTI